MVNGKITYVQLNGAAVRELLKSSEMQDMLSNMASGMASRAGDGYASDVKIMPTRAIASAYTATPDAMRDNLNNNTLLKEMK